MIKSGGFFRKNILKSLFFPFLFLFVFTFPSFVSAAVVFPDSQKEAKTDFSSKTGLISHSDGEQKLYLKIDDKTKAEELAWIIPTPGKPKDKMVYPVDTGDFKDLDEDFGLEFKNYGEESWEHLWLYEFQVFSSNEDISEWFKNNGYDLDPGVELIIQDYKDRGWYLTATIMVSDPFTRIVELLDRELEKEVTKGNIHMELANYFFDSMNDPDFEKFRSLTDYLMKIDPYEFKSLKEVSREEFDEETGEFSGLSDEEKEEYRNELAWELLEVIYIIKEFEIMRSPYDYIETVVEKFDREVEVNINKDNLARNLSEYYIGSIKDNDIDKYRKALNFLSSIFIDDPFFIGIQLYDEIEKELEEMSENFNENFSEEEKEDFTYVFKKLIQGGIEELTSGGLRDDNNSYITPLKLVFDSDKPVYPLQSFDPISSDMDVSFYVVTDAPVKDLDSWEVYSKEKINPRNYVLPRQNTIVSPWESEDFLLATGKAFGRNELMEDIVFEFAEGIPKEYLNKPSIDSQDPYYVPGKSEAGLKGIIFNMGEAEKVETWFEWGRTEDLEKKTQTQTHFLKDSAGIGVQLRKKDEELLIVSSLMNSPALRKGLNRGDKILEIDGYSVNDMELEEASDRIRGKEGTEVTLVVDKGKGEEEVVLSRGLIKEDGEIVYNKNVSETLSGLEAGTYYYRFVAENEVGSVHGEVKKFTVQFGDEPVEEDFYGLVTDPKNLTQEALDLRESVRGKIVLRVEEKGEAYYIDPDLSMYFLGRPADAFQVMREQGIGITNQDLYQIQPSLEYLTGTDSDGDGLPDAFEEAMGTDPLDPDTSGNGYCDWTEIKHGYDPLKKEGRLPIDEDFARSQAGRILLQVENKGQAWYINPENNLRYFLGRPNDAFEIMRNLGLGVSEDNFETLNKRKGSDARFGKKDNGIVYCDGLNPGENFYIEDKRYLVVDDTTINESISSKERICTSHVTIMSTRPDYLDSKVIFSFVPERYTKELNISDWDVSNVENMNSMFYWEPSFNQDIGNWDVSNVRDMRLMFSGADSFNQDIGDWDVSKVEDMNSMFSGADSFNQDIGDWDVGNVRDMRAMFSYTESFNQDIGNWDVNNVENMYGMFAGARSFNQDLSNWDVSNVKDYFYFDKDVESWREDYKPEFKEREMIDWDEWQDPHLFGGDRDMNIVNEHPFVGTGADEVLLGSPDEANVLDASAGGDNILWARGQGKEDTMIGGPGDDHFVVLGDLTPYQKSDSPETTKILGGPLSDLNGYNFNEDADGGRIVIKGGGGENTLHLIGDMDASNFDISGVDHLKIH